MASFSKYKTKKGEFWKFQFYSGIDPKTGKRRLTTRRGFKTKKEAQLVAEELEKQVRSGIFKNNELTYEEVYKEWWITHVKTIKLSTQSRKNSLFKKHILPRFGKIKFKDISRTYCQEAIDDMFEDLQSYSSTNDVKIQANLVFKYAMKQDYIERNPMEHVVVPKKEEDFLAREDERNYWNKDEVIHFMNLIKEHHYHYHHYILFYLLIYTGMRKGELFALEWDDVDLINKTIRINKTLYFKDGKEYIQTTKKRASNRVISISDSDVKLLKKWDRQDIIIELLNSQNDDGSWPLNTFFNTPDIDVTGMVLTGLSSYKDQDEVNLALDRAVEWLSDQQMDNGGFFAGDFVGGIIGS